MKVLLLVLMMVFIVVPCQAAEIYNAQFTDNNGVYTGNADFVICDIKLESGFATYLVDFNNELVKISEVNGKDPASGKKEWMPIKKEVLNEIAEYVAANYDSILLASRSNPQHAYRKN